MSIALTYLKENWQRLALERFGEPAGLSCVMATPRFRSSSHIIFFVLANGSRVPNLVIKVPRIPGDYHRLAREAENLERVHAIQPGGFASIPSLVASEDYLGNWMLVETALAGATMSSRLRGFLPGDAIEAVVSWLVDLHQASAIRSVNQPGWYTRIAQEPLEHFMRAMPVLNEEVHMLKRTQALTRVLRDCGIPLVFEHRDLGPPNILLSAGGQLGVVDWELAEPKGLPAVDLFFFLTLVMFVRRRARTREDYLAAFHDTFFGESAWARPYISQYAQGMDLSPHVLPPLFILCWSRYVAGLLARLHDLDTSRPTLDNGTAEWLRSNRYFDLWRHTLHHIDELNLL